MGIESLEREARLKRIAARRGMVLKLDPNSDTTKRRWLVWRSGVIASGLTLDQVDEFLEPPRNRRRGGGTES
jgi:hypothetical protein